MLKFKSNLSIKTVSLAFFILISYSGFVFAEKNEISQQVLTVQGKVSDPAGNSMPGVNVLVKGTTIGVITDIDGRFSVTVPNLPNTLVFSFIGFLPKEVIVSNLSFLNVSLSEDVTSLEEVVVVGYGTQRKRDLTGSVATANIENIQNNAVSNIRTCFARQNGWC